MSPQNKFKWNNVRMRNLGSVNFPSRYHLVQLSYHVIPSNNYSASGSLKNCWLSVSGCSLPAFVWPKIRWLMHLVFRCDFWDSESFNLFKLGSQVDLGMTLILHNAKESRGCRKLLNVFVNFLKYLTEACRFQTGQSEWSSACRLQL